MNKNSDSEFKVITFVNDDVDLSETCPRYSKTKEDNLNNSKDSKKLRDFKVTSNSWILFGLSAGILFGLSNVFVGEASSNGIQTRVLVGIGNAFASIIFLISQGIYNIYYNNGNMLNYDLF